jgi:hypothetical protein
MPASPNGKGVGEIVRSQKDSKERTFDNRSLFKNKLGA